METVQFLPGIKFLIEAVVRNHFKYSNPMTICCEQQFIAMERAWI